MVQWLRTSLPVQGTQVQSLVQKDPTCPGAAKSGHQNYRQPSCSIEDPVQPGKRERGSKSGKLMSTVKLPCGRPHPGTFMDTSFI